MRRITSFVLALCIWLISSNGFAAINNERVLAGTIKRAFIDYKSTSEVYIKTGYGDCGGKYWEVESDITYSFGTIGTLSSPTVYYIYIDDSAATYPSLNTASFTHSTTAPTWSDAKQGWYNGDDRNIAAVLMKTTGAIMPFEATGDNKIYFTEFYQVGSTLTANNQWMMPQTDTDDVTPINTQSIFYYAATQSSAVTWVRIGTTSNYLNQHCQYSYAASVPVMAWLDVQPGGDRTIGVCGYSTTSSINSWLKGWQIER